MREVKKEYGSKHKKKKKKFKGEGVKVKSRQNFTSSQFIQIEGE